MKVIKPVVFDATQLLSTTATETYATYSAGTTYSIGNRVIYNLTDVYESLTNANTGNNPATSTTNWLRVSSSNKYAMFDNQVNSQTTATETFEVSIQPGMACNSIALLNVTNITSIEIEVLDALLGNVVYSSIIDMDLISVFDWYTYFFNPFDLRDTLVLTNLPIYNTCVINITFTGSSTIGVGAVLYGNYFEIGTTQYGTTVGNKDYSVKETDEFGNTTFVKRAYSKRMEPQLVIDNTDLRYVFKTLNDLRATPTVWIGSEDIMLDPLVMYGFYRDYDIDISYPTSSLVRLSIEGLI